ncbi:MAG: YfiR family protein [Methylococcales bacterium]
MPKHHPSRHRKKLLLALCLLSSSLLITSTLADSVQEYNVKAAITLNFARFTEWPESALKKDSPKITLCVLGDNVVQQAFTEIDNKQVGNRTLTVSYLSRLRNLEECHMLYVSGLDKNKTIQLLTEINNQHILSIGEQEYFVDYGGIINLAMINGKINIQINIDAAKQAGLTISSRVLKLATIVKPK